MKLSGIEMSYTWSVAGMAGITQEGLCPFGMLARYGSEPIIFCLTVDLTYNTISSPVSM